MKFTELWIGIEKRHPQVKEGMVHMSTANFKKALRFAYDKGYGAANAGSCEVIDDIMGMFK